MAVQHPADDSVINHLFRCADTFEEIHYMACHKSNIVGNACLHHLHTVLIGQGNGLFTEYMYPVLRGLDDRFLVKIIGRCHDYGIHILTAV